LIEGKKVVNEEGKKGKLLELYLLYL